MFSSCYSLINDSKTRGVPYFDTSNVVDMSSMFSSCRKLKTVPMFDTSSVTNMLSMFTSCRELKRVPLFNTTNVITMQSMFNNCNKLNSVPNFNTSSVNNMSSMFQGCNNLQSVPNFDTSNVTTMRRMFYVAALTGGSLVRLPNFDTSNVTNMERFASGQSRLIYVPEYDYSSVVDMDYAYNNCETLRKFPSINAPNLTDMVALFYDCYNLKEVGDFNIPLVESLISVFRGCHRLTSVGEFTTTNSLTNTSNMFYDCYILKEVPFLVCDNVTSMSSMFNGCYSLLEIPAYNAPSVISMSYTFKSCYLIKSIPNSINFSNVTNLLQCFIGCVNLIELPVMDLTSCTNLDFTFNSCSLLKEVNIINGNNLQLCSETFENCNSLEVVNLESNLFTIYDTERMFNGCISLKSVGTFSVSGNGSTSAGVEGMFQNCVNLVDVDVLFDTANIVYFRSMFSGCNKLKSTPSIDLSNSNNDTAQLNIFANCHSLSEFNITGNKKDLSLFRTNIGYDEYVSFVSNLGTADVGSWISLYQTPVLPYLMDINERIPLLNKGYVYFESASYDYTWDDLYVYTPFDSPNVYPGSGSDVFDVSGYNYPLSSSNDGILVNTPTYGVDHFEFNGSDQAIDFGTHSTTQLSAVTLFAVIEPLTIQSGQTHSIIGRYGTNSNDNYFLDITDGKLRFGFMDTSLTKRELISEQNLSVGETYFVAARHDNSSNSSNIWIGDRTPNLSFDNLGAENMIIENDSKLSVAGNLIEDSDYFNVNIYDIGVYGRSLSEVEIIELYYKYRKRGLVN